MKPTTPLRCNFSVFATTPCRGLSLSRLADMKPQHAILRSYTIKVAQLGFSRLRSTWWQRTRGVLLERVHIHKLSFTTGFRVHTALHVVGFGEDAVWLNGLLADDSGTIGPGAERPMLAYSFRFNESSSSWDTCAEELFAFTREVAVPWFDKWSDISLLQTDANSPLHERQRAYLASA
jgi:hypothetical protein